MHSATSRDKVCVPTEAILLTKRHTVPLPLNTHCHKVISIYKYYTGDDVVVCSSVFVDAVYQEISAQRQWLMTNCHLVGLLLCFLGVFLLTYINETLNQGFFYYSFYELFISFTFCKSHNFRQTSRHSFEFPRQSSQTCNPVGACVTFCCQPSS